MRTLPGAHPGTGVSEAAARAFVARSPLSATIAAVQRFSVGAAELCNVLRGVQCHSYGVLEG